MRGRQDIGWRINREKSASDVEIDYYPDAHVKYLAMKDVIKYQIQIPVDRSRTDFRDVKGRRFESVVAKFLDYQSYKIESRVRDAGTEIDLLCRSKLSDDVVIVECKAQVDNIDAAVVNKLFTDAVLHDANHGWIFAVATLGKEATARLKKLNEKERREKYKIFTANDIVEVLLASHAITFPKLDTKSEHTEFMLCVFERALYWAAHVRDTKGDRPIGHLAWSTATGEPLQARSLPEISNTDFPFPDLTWIDHQKGTSPHERATGNVSDSQPVVEVIPGEEWSDYRPSRPVDFVGRKGLISDIEEFFERIRSKNTNSRLFGIKGQSGWGKSSLAIKLAYELRSNKIVITAVDCRAAKASYYPDLVISKALRNAAEVVMPGPLFRFDQNFESNPFESESVKSLLAMAQDNGFVICVIFDQFEEIIHRAELGPVFDRLRELALKVDELRSCLVVGFSWKTDGTVGSDYPGYHLWHSLSDRRKDFSVDKFAREDADEFIELAQRESRVRLKSNVVKFIIENYAGLPWLLKKLVRHYTDETSKSNDANTIGSLLTLESLFQSDLQEITDSERRAIQFIAQHSPVEYGSTADKYGSQIISSLVNKRLVINTGGRLNLYWDIFKEYILYNEVPQLPNTYVPTISVRRIRGILRIILREKNISYDSLSKELSISIATTDNAVRDLQNLGLVKANRSEQVFSKICDSSSDATKRVIEFLRTHAVYMRAEEIILDEGSASFRSICDVAKGEYAFISIDERTLENYIRKILLYCINFGLLAKDGRNFSLGEPVGDIFEVAGKNTRINEIDLFRAAAPPERVVELIDRMKEGNCPTRTDAEAIGLRNAVFAASSLGLILNRSGEISLTDRVARHARTDEAVRTAAWETNPFKDSLQKISNTELSADEIGSVVADFYGLNWSPGSCRRHGSALKRWLSWME